MEDNKIIEHYKSNFNSSPVEITKDEIDFVNKHNCKCDNCGKSIFNMDDFPELLIDEDGLMCENCYSEEYRETCPICEESYDTKDFTNNYFILDESSSKELKMKAGIYEIIKRPFIFGNILSGFESFFEDNIKLVLPININEFKKIDVGNMCCEVYSDMICPECVEKFIRKS